MSSRLCVLLIVSVLFGFLLPGCASPGSPQVPSLRLPKPVDDLTATRKGDHVLLTWTPPTKTTDNENIRRVGGTAVCRGIDSSPMVHCEQKLAMLSDAQASHWTKSMLVSRHDYTDTLSAALQTQFPLGEAAYALEDFNPNGRSAGLSNQVRVPLAPTLPPPAGITAKVTGDGVVLTWPGSVPPVENSALIYSYRVFRKNLTDSKQPELIVGEAPVSNESIASFVDRNIDWEVRYAYHLDAVTHVEKPGVEPVEVEGDDSPVVDVFTHDIFPPATPTGLQAVASGVGQKPFLDLSWAPNLERDLAGYNVYRHEPGAAAVKANTELAKVPSFRDSNVQPGHTYFYSVSAVDKRGNESGRSAEASEHLPD